jgi:hypothetical protein
MVRLVAIALVLLALPASADRDAASTDETERWVPAVGLFWGLFGQDARATVASGSLTGSSPPEPVRPSAVGQESLLTPFIGGSFELMTPSLFDRYGRPRIFAHIDATAALGFTFDVAREGTAGALQPPEPGLPEFAIGGQRSATSAEVDTLVVTAGFGLAFTLDAGGRRFRIKPSFEYLREKIIVSGVVNRAVFVDPIPTDVRLIRLHDQTTKTYQSIGPGLELELDAARFAPFTMSTFISGQAYALLDSSGVVLTDTYTDAYGTESAIWRFQPNDWVFRGAMGIRFRWLPD